MNRTHRTAAEQQVLVSHVKENYVYDADVGSVRRKGYRITLKGRKMGPLGYLQIAIRYQKRSLFILNHTAVWMVCKGRWPIGTIDHIDGNPQNNHIENLRECSLGENRLNMELPWKVNAVTGVPGVVKNGRKYRCWVRGIYLAFDNPYEAFFYATLCGKRYRCA